jgi:hypothetical protein
MDLFQSFDVVKVGYMSKRIVEFQIKIFEKQLTLCWNLDCLNMAIPRIVSSKSSAFGAFFSQKSFALIHLTFCF